MTVLHERLSPSSLSSSAPLERLGDSRSRESQLSSEPRAHGLSQRRMPALKCRKQWSRNSRALRQLRLRPTCELAQIHQFALGLRYADQVGHFKAQDLRDTLKPIHLRRRSTNLPGGYGCRADRKKFVFGDNVC